MSGALTYLEPVIDCSAPALPAMIGPELERAANFAQAANAASTRRAYGTDFRIFTSWCQDRGLSALPARSEAVAAFLAYEAEQGAKPSTIGRRCAAIRYGHRLAGEPNPTADERVKAVLRGIRRTVGAAPRRMAPATADRIIAMAPRPDSTLTSLRDRALLLLGFAGAFRRSELVALDVADIERLPEGLRVTIRRGKTDQEGHGATIAIVRGEVACPVAAVVAWLEAAVITDGPVFRPIRRGGHVQPQRLTDRSVANIVKTHAERVGLDPAQFAGHSLRAGFLTSAAKRGASLFKMMATSRHKSTDTLAGYVRDQEIFRDHAGAGLL